MSYIQKTAESIHHLDLLNQRIWESGFDTFSLKELDNVVQEIENGTKVFERIPQEQQPAAIICRGCPRTRSEVRKIYDTDDLIGEGAIQERLVEIWARIKGCWYEYPEMSLLLAVM